MSDKEQAVKIMHNEKEYEFLLSELSEEGQAQFQRATQLSTSCMRMEQDLTERRFLVNNYIKFVVDEIDSKEQEDASHDKPEK